MALIITNNSPSAGYIAWTGLVIELKGVQYNVNDDNSNYKFLWWDADNPNDLQESNTSPSLTKDDCIVFFNSSGTAYFVPNATMLRGEQIYDGTIAQAKVDTAFLAVILHDRVYSVASTLAPEPDIDSYDTYIITALAGNPTFAAPSGSPVQGQKLIIRIKDDGTARVLAWNAIYRAISADLPTTTVASKTMYLGFMYNSTDSKWDLIAYVEEE